MDYNDILSRLTRTFASLNNRFDEDTFDHMKFTEWPDGKGMSITWDKVDNNEVLNKIMPIMHNLASLKDNLKNCLMRNGHDKQIVEITVDGSLHLQVLIDIVNQEKHGTPLKRSRSSKNPVISDARYQFRMGSKKGSPLEDAKNEFSPTMFIDAIIEDNLGNYLFTLDEMVETCFLKWKELAEQYDCGKM